MSARITRRRKDLRATRVVLRSNPCNPRYLRRQVSLPVSYDDVLLDCGYIANIIVAGDVILELKSVERILTAA